MLQRPSGRPQSCLISKKLVYKNDS